MTEAEFDKFLVSILDTTIDALDLQYITSLCRVQAYGRLLFTKTKESGGPSWQNPDHLQLLKDFVRIIVEAAVYDVQDRITRKERFQYWQRPRLRGKCKELDALVAELSDEGESAEEESDDDDVICLGSILPKRKATTKASDIEDQAAPEAFAADRKRQRT